jgi:hypothetical protein
MNKPEGCCRYNRQGKHLDPDEIKVLYITKELLLLAGGKANIVAEFRQRGVASSSQPQ